MPSQPERTSFTTTLLHHAADPFRLLVENVKDYAIYLLDPAGRIASWIQVAVSRSVAIVRSSLSMVRCPALRRGLGARASKRSLPAAIQGLPASE